MSKRFFKLFSIASVVAMLVAAVGVIPAGAAGPGPWYDSRTTALANPTTLPFYAADALDGAINMNTSNTSSVGNLGGCIGGSSFGLYQLHMYVATGLTTTLYARVRVASTDIVVGSWAVRISLDDGTLTQAACGTNNPTGVVDIVGTIPAGATGFYVTLASVSGFIPGAASTYKNWVFTTTNAGGGLLVNMAGDAGAGLNRDVEASPLGGSAPTDAIWAGGTFGVAAASYSAVLDVPAGTYNLGFQDQTVGTELAVLDPGVVVPSLTGPGYLEINPTALATDKVAVVSKNEAGAPLNGSTLKLTPSNGALVADLSLGVINDAGVPASGAAGTFFNASPGTWDVESIQQALNGPDYLLVQLSEEYILVTDDVIFNEATDGAFVNMRTGIAYTSAELDINPPGKLNPVVIDFRSDGNSVNLWLTAGEAYFAGDSVVLTQGAWTYSLRPTLTNWDFLPDVVIAGYEPAFGKAPFITTGGAADFGYTAPASVGIARGNWVDSPVLACETGPIPPARDCDTGNILYEVANGAVEKYPVDSLTRGIDPAGPQLLEDPSTWAITGLGPVTAIGRYRYQRTLDTGPVLNLPVNNVFYIQPSDTDVVAYPLWSYVMAMYEEGWTTGTGATTFGPSDSITRAQMAIFLAKALDDNGLTFVTPLTASFSDVPTTPVAVFRAVEWMKYLNITSGCTPSRFCPGATVDRAQMAIFIEKAARAIVADGGTNWNGRLDDLGSPGGPFNTGWLSLGTIIRNTVGFDGFFADVTSSTQIGAIFIEELAADGITAGISGIPGSDWMYGPSLPLTRGQMATFLARSWYNADPGWFPFFPGPTK